MAHTVYMVGDGNFATTDQPFAGEFLLSWPCTDSEATQIAEGADLSFDGLSLVISPPVTGV